MDLSCLLLDEQSLPYCCGNGLREFIKRYASAQWGVYSKFNRCHKRVGHVFQGRYKAILVEKDSYLLELSRYVVLNPVRARMVSDAGDWPWSSYQAMISQAVELKCLKTDWLLSQFGTDRNKALIQYQNFVRSGVGLPPVWEGLNNQIFLGKKLCGKHAKAD